MSAYIGEVVANQQISVLMQSGEKMRLIDADALENLCDLQTMLLYGGFEEAVWKQFSAIVELAPTIDPVKHGKWINDKGLYKCSMCGELWTAWWAVACTEERMYATVKFCPNCGAKMDGEVVIPVERSEAIPVAVGAGGWKGAKNDRNNN